MMTEQDTLGRERAVFETHLEDWRRDHLGEFVVIKDDAVLGFFRSLEEAFGTGTRQYGLAPFFVRQIVPRETVNVSFFGRRLSA